MQVINLKFIQAIFSNHKIECLWKKFIGIFLLASVTIMISCKKEKIQAQNVTDISFDTQSRINDILCLSDTYWVAVGGQRYKEALILESRDKGMHWSRQQYDDSNARKEVYHVLFKNNVGMAVGLDGKIFIKSQEDSLWRYNQTRYWDVNKCMDYAGNDHGFIVGGSSYNFGFMVYTDGDGNTTGRDTFPYELDCIQFITPQTGFVSGYGVVLKTTDAGLHWQMLNVEGDYFKSLFCMDENNVWTVGYEGTVAYTKDGGATWSKIRNGNGVNFKKERLNKIVFKDSREGYIVGDKGLLLQTTDGGDDWKVIKKFTDNDLYAISFDSQGNVVVAGESGAIFCVAIK